MSKHYPGAEIKVVYEAGFCGFGIQRSLNKLGEPGSNCSLFIESRKK
jgi:hypothetical protein